MILEQYLHVKKRLDNLLRLCPVFHNQVHRMCVHRHRHGGPAAGPHQYHHSGPRASAAGVHQRSTARTEIWTYVVKGALSGGTWGG